jgi:hypothetical protein
MWPKWCSTYTRPSLKPSTISNNDDDNDDDDATLNYNLRRKIIY